MKEIYQNKFGKKEGNCFPACIASILEMKLEDVPQFMDGNGIWYKKYRTWLQSIGMDLIALKPCSDPEYFHPKVFCIVSGTSPRGFKHSTVWYENNIVHDPHPEGGGITDIEDYIYIIPTKYLEQKGGQNDAG